jgi:hypothetical protein
MERNQPKQDLISLRIQMTKIAKISDIPEDQRTPLVVALFEIIEL